MATSYKYVQPSRKAIKKPEESAYKLVDKNGKPNAKNQAKYDKALNDYYTHSSAPEAETYRAEQIKQQYGGILDADGKPIFTDKDFTNLASGKYDAKVFNTKLTNLASTAMLDPNYNTDYANVSGGAKGKVYQADLAKLASDPAQLQKIMAANRAASKAAADKAKTDAATNKTKFENAQKAKQEEAEKFKPYTTDASGYNTLYKNTPNQKLTQTGADKDTDAFFTRGIAGLAKSNIPPATGAVPPANTAPALSNVTRVAPDANTGVLPANTAGLINLPQNLTPAPNPVLDTSGKGLGGLPTTPMKKGGIASLSATNKFVAKTHKVPVTGIAKALKAKMSKK